MSQIIEYKAIMSYHPDELTREVNVLIREGYQPAGGLCSANKDGEPYVLQAVVKYKNPPEQELICKH